MKGIQGKKAIVTGGAQGIGRACIERLAESGCEIFFSDMGENGEATLRTIKRTGCSHILDAGRYVR